MFDFKNASKKELRKEYRRIAQTTGDDRFFTKKELYHLPKILMDEEQVLAFSSGLMDGNTWLIALTDKRVVFLDKGLLFGTRQTSVPIDKISAVSGKTGVLFGKITIHAGGGEMTITNVLKHTVLPFTNKLQEVIGVGASGS